MATGKALDGKPCAGKPHVRLDEGEVASMATPRRRSLLYNKKLFVMLVVGAVSAAWADSYTLSPDQTFYESTVSAGSVVSYNADTYNLQIPDGMYAKVSLSDSGFSWGNCRSAHFSAIIGGRNVSLDSTAEVSSSTTISISISCSPDVYCNPYNVVGTINVAGVSFPRYYPSYHEYSSYYAKQSYTIRVSYFKKLPDLYVSAISLSESAVAVDEKARLSFTVRNGGRLAAGNATVVRVFDGTRQIGGDVSVGALASGASSDHVVELPELTAGSHDICVKVDALGNLAESSEVNNASTVSLRVYARTDVGVTFDLNGGGKSATMSVVAGDRLAFLPTVERPGYDFLGWWTAKSGGSKLAANEKITQPCTFYAHWLSRTTTITFNRRGGSGGTRTTVATYDSVLPSITPPARAGYDFGGYWTEPNGVGEQVYSADGSGLSAWRIDQREATLYAKWNGRAVMFSLNRQGGVGGPSSVTTVYGDVPLSITVPTRPGWVFQGYFTKENGEGTRFYAADGTGTAVVAELEDSTLYAYWLPVSMECSLAFDLQGGTGTSSVKATYGNVLPSVPVPVRDGYAFKGYFTEPDGGGTQYVYADGTGAVLWDGVMPVKLYAKWEKAYRVVLDPNGGEGERKTHFFAESAWKLAMNTFTSNGCVFAGWALEPDGVPVYPDEAVLGKELLGYGDDPDAEPVTLYAAWGKLFAPSLFPGFTFVTGGMAEDGGWLVEDGVLRSGHTGAASWLCTVVDGFGELSYSCTNAVFSFFNAGGVYTNDCSGKSVDVASALGGKHLAVWATKKGFQTLFGKIAPTDNEVVLQDLFAQKQQELAAVITEFYTSLWPMIYYDNNGRGESTCRITTSNYINAVVNEWRGEHLFSSGSVIDPPYNNNLRAGLLSDIMTKFTYSGYKVYSLNQWLKNWSPTAQEINEKAFSVMGVIDDLNTLEIYVTTFGDLVQIEWVPKRFVGFVEDAGVDISNAQAAYEEIERIRWEYEKLIAPICALVVPYRKSYVSAEEWRIAIEEIMLDVLNGTQKQGYWDGSLVTYMISMLGAAGRGYNVYDLKNAVVNHNINLSKFYMAEKLVAEVHALEQSIVDCGIKQYQIIDVGDCIGSLPIPETRYGYMFEGWFDENENAVGEDTKVAEDMIIHAKWSLNTYNVSFDANGGTEIAAQTVEHGERIALPAAPTREGYVFEGWYCDIEGNTVAQDSSVANDNVIYYAIWTKDSSVRPSSENLDSHFVWNGVPDDSRDGSAGSRDVPSPGTLVLYGRVSGAAPSAVLTYDGYLYRGGTVAGTIQVKVGKPNKKTGLAAVKATVVGLDGKKKVLKAAGKGKAQISATGPTTVSLTGGDACEVTLGAKGMSGKYGNYDIDGALNVFMSKDAADRAVAASVLGKWQGMVNVAWEGAQGWNGLSVSIAAKGKVKVSGALANGTKVSAKGQLIVGETWCCVPVLVTKKAGFAFVLWLPRNGGATEVEGLASAVSGKPGSLKAGSAFRLDGSLGDARFAAYLPDGLPVSGGAKWSVPKAGKVTYKKGTTTVDETKLGDNPSALKLTCKAKDGSFKGSFKAYAVVNGKLKATNFKVTGVLVNGVGYGSAAVKKGGGAPVKIE